MRWMKQTIAILLLFCVFTVVQQEVQAGLSRQTFITVKVNDNFVKMDVQPYITDGRTHVSIRFIAETLGADVIWEPEKEKAVILYEDTEIEMYVDDNILLVNDIKQTMDTSIEIVDGRIMVPVRFIAENLDCGVKWDESTYSVVIEKEDIEISKDYIYEREYTDEDLMWLARITNVEGGGLSLDARVAIANVVLNRKESPRFPDNIYDVIFDKAYNVQFPPAHRDGFKELEPTRACIISSKMALEGVNNIDNALFFNNVPFATNSVTLHEIIDGMYFYF
ncbi:stalk domain-containing protein [Herbivorax sp. ANBcel31]|uniref:stalk domain-containing protein n=1 Tax=Herbivorax sp. ANBcel31 TaxID=3069754 RepID=UPI0027B258E4|nr:stalk domain-containing protein [Herbivorax sp. ANBcel31]MDQ2084853.1 stalk domain-containing protein [Herbivorax sp. ANBcel31]